MFSKNQIEAIQEALSFYTVNQSMTLKQLRKWVILENIINDLLVPTDNQPSQSPD